MKELYKLELDGKITQIVSSEDGVTITVGDNKLELTTDHQQDCCESVYGDFSNFKFHAEEIIKLNPKVMTIYGDDSPEGIGLVIKFDDYAPASVLIPCHDNQNGYYSSNLDLCISYKGVHTTIDIQEFEQSSGY